MSPGFRLLVALCATWMLAAMAWPANAIEFSDPAPGYYRIRALDAGLCLGVKGQWGFEAPHLVLQRCDEPFDLLRNYVAIIPTGEPQTYTIRLYALSREANLRDRTRLDYCVTRARNVVLGAPRTDVYLCDLPSDISTWCQVGHQDQRFRFRKVTGGPRPTFNILYYGPNPGYTGSWHVRNASRDLYTDVLIEDSPTGLGRSFELVFDRALDTPDDIACLTPDPIDPRRALQTAPHLLPGH